MGINCESHRFKPQHLMVPVGSDSVHSQKHPVHHNQRQKKINGNADN